MKPVVAVGKAWFCTVLSVFAIVILSTIGALFRSGAESMTGSTEDPDNPKEVAATIFMAVAIYAVFLVFCGWQAFLHATQRGRGDIAL
ncbi:hypothetical protein BJ508DRAFT_410874 [Ascobolus immersus RN42]|uniref:Uncharacterized protein n=1 Tax=Ascobolus immersus RN42 TaxID=1160509 RepID=A0A3N4IML1_ASCIM|nr:hypothetical protein BJ508DRAFT_410874 [Ascobolus immersus RN42]